VRGSRFTLTPAPCTGASFGNEQHFAARPPAVHAFCRIPSSSWRLSRINGGNWWTRPTSPTRIFVFAEEFVCAGSRRPKQSPGGLLADPAQSSFGRPAAKRAPMPIPCPGAQSSPSRFGIVPIFGVEGDDEDRRGILSSPDAPRKSLSSGTGAALTCHKRGGPTL